MKLTTNYRFFLQTKHQMALFLIIIILLIGSQPTENKFLNVKQLYEESLTLVADYFHTDIWSNNFNFIRLRVALNSEEISLFIQKEELQEHSHIKLNDLVILSGNEIFFNKIDQVQKILQVSNQALQNHIYRVLSKVRKSHDMTKCIIFISSMSNQGIYRNLLQMSSPIKRQVLNGLCFDNQNEVTIFKKLFEKAYSSFLTRKGKITEKIEFLKEPKHFEIKHFNSTRSIPLKVVSNSMVPSQASLKKSQIFIFVNSMVKKITYKYNYYDIRDCSALIVNNCLNFSVYSSNNTINNFICGSRPSLIKNLIDIVSIKNRIISSCESNLKEILKRVSQKDSDRQISVLLMTFSKKYLIEFLVKNRITNNHLLTKIKQIDRNRQIKVSTIPSSNIHITNQSSASKSIRKENTKKNLTNLSKTNQTNNNNFSHSNKKTPLQNSKNTSLNREYVFNSSSGIGNSIKVSIENNLTSQYVQNKLLSAKKSSSLQKDSEEVIERITDIPQSIRDKILQNSISQQKRDPDDVYQKYQTYFDSSKSNDSPKSLDKSVILFESPFPFIKQGSDNFLSNGIISSNKCDRAQVPPEFLIADVCNKNDIYCLCKNHPQYKNCVCSAYPTSVICKKNYCKEHCDEYECNPSRCDFNEGYCDKCLCKNNMDDLKCKCRLNPFSEECFCFQYPSSHLCSKRVCQFNPNSLFCACKTSLRPDLCSPDFCVNNPLNPYCKCITHPSKGECLCLNDPSQCSNSKLQLIQEKILWKQLLSTI